MSNETTDHAARIAEIKARLEAATPGPWTATNKNRGVMLASPDRPVIDLQPHETEVMDVHRVDVRIFDMDLIANAPADLRWAITTLTAALARAERAEAELSGVRGLTVICEDLATKYGKQLDDAQKALGDTQAENVRLRAEVVGLGPVRFECGENPDEWHMCRIYHEGCANKYKRHIRVVQQEGVGDAKPTHDNMGRRAEEL